MVTKKKIGLAPIKILTTGKKLVLGYYGKKLTLNDSDREQWIDNDEGLYNWWKSSKQSKKVFIKENREELTTLIKAALNKEPRKY